MKKIMLLLLTTLVAISLVACSEDESENPTVYITAYPIKYLVETIGDSLVDVKYVPGSTAHGHGFDWAGQEIIDMQNAEILFYMGAGLDPYITTNYETLNAGSVSLVKITDYVTPIEVCMSHDHIDEDEDEHHHEDEDEHDYCEDAELMEDAHLWLDVIRMQEIASLIKDRLILAFPESDTLIKNNYVVIEKQLEKLHEDYVDALENVTKPIITNVKLFSYYEARYGLVINPFTKNAHSHEDESTPTDYPEFVNYAVANDINYILFESNANSPAGETLLSELQKVNLEASKLYLHPLGYLTKDEVLVGRTYISIMYDNLATLIQATQ